MVDKSFVIRRAPKVEPIQRVALGVQSPMSPPAEFLIAYQDSMFDGRIRIKEGAVTGGYSGSFVWDTGAVRGFANGLLELCDQAEGK